MPGDSVADRVRLFGIRHHGPGSARSLLAGLNEWRPTALLIEGPAEAESLLEHVLHPELKPPVALLFHAVDNPRWAAYYPLVEFSPELQALRWAARSDVPVAFMDLPASAMLAMSVVRDRSSDALELMAEAAGFEDTEDWWEHLVEQRHDPRELFEGIEALMSALREGVGPAAILEEESEDKEDARQKLSDQDYQEIREAHMRRSLRAALDEGHERIGVVCGVWHVPALRVMPKKSQDENRLKGLPKVKVGSTVVPWSYERLTFASGYGAGARSPAFYDLLWHSPAEEVTRRWLLSVARLMREEDLDASPASVIEAVRLAEALAALRGRPKPGLRELGEAATSVLVRDEAVWMLISKRLIVGERLGEVPPSIPALPLQADISAIQRRLRMSVDDTDRTLELDLRGDTDLERSRFLHRLLLLGIDWGEPVGVSGKKGTFHEHWRIRWTPDLALSVIEASPHGNTVLTAAVSLAAEDAQRSKSLHEVSKLVEQVLLADLEDAVEPVVSKLQALSATAADVAELADALPPLAAMVRYGTVRRTEADRVNPVLDAIFTRLCIGLPRACASLDDEAARAMAGRLTAVAGVVQLLDDASKLEEWKVALEAVSGLQGCHGLVLGKAERLRFDLGMVDGEHLAARLQSESSRGATALETSAFVEGMLDGPGAILLHQEALFKAIDEWVCSLDETIFDEILPLIRRTFALFTRPERRQIGEKVAGGVALARTETGFHEERAMRVLPVVRKILGLDE